MTVATGCPHKTFQKYDGSIHEICLNKTNRHNIYDTNWAIQIKHLHHK